MYSDGRRQTVANRPEAGTQTTRHLQLKAVIRSVYESRDDSGYGC